MTVRSAIENLMQAPKRRRLAEEGLAEEGLAEQGYTNSAMSASAVMMPSTAASASTAMTPSIMMSTSVAMTASNTATARTAALEADSLSGSATALNPRGQELTSASFLGVMDILPPYMCGAINPKDGNADVTMSFPVIRRNGPTPYCLVSMAIKASEVLYIAMQLFPVHIGVEDGVRHMVLANGGRFTPPSFHFQGSLECAISRLLGPMISKAIAGSPVREEELAQGIVATRCVTMSFAANAQEGGVLNLSLGLNDGVLMRDKLYRDETR